MSFVSRGFRGRRRDGPADGGRVPPGQYLTDDFPVLSAGPTPRTPLEEWSFSITGEVDEPRTYSWDEFRALPTETITRDIHCVTKWSKLDTVWEGVPVSALLEGHETAAEYVVAFCDGGYTTNLPLEDVAGGNAWVVHTLRRSPARPGARRAGAAPRPAPLLLEEREMGARPGASARGRAGLLGGLRLPQLRRPVERAAVLGRLTLAPRRGRRDRARDRPGGDPRARRSTAGPATAPGSTSTCGSRPRTATRPSAATRSPRRRASRWCG